MIRVFLFIVYFLWLYSLQQTARYRKRSGEFKEVRIYRFYAHLRSEKKSG